MIKVETRYDEYAYRIADGYLDGTVGTVEEGQWVTFNASNNLVVADETAPKAFLVIGSKRPGRNQIAGVPVKKVSFLHGIFRLKVSNFDNTKTYAATMTPLKVVAGGILAPWVSGTDNASLIVAWAQGQPTDGYLSIFSA